VRPDAFSRRWPDSTWTESRPCVWCSGMCALALRGQDDTEVVVLHERSSVLTRVSRRLTVKPIDFCRQIEFEKRTGHRWCVRLPMSELA
jgi:hypothetical protein